VKGDERPMRRFVADPDFRAGFAEMVPACVGIAPFGLVCGVGAAAAGAPLAVIVLTCFVAGLRFLIYSAAMAPYLRPLPPRWQQGLAFLLTDQAFAASVRRFDSGGDAHAGGMHFLGGGFALWAFWQVTNIAGYFVGNLIPPAWSLDFAVPLCFIALLAPHFRTMPTIAAALVAGALVLALAGLPMKLNLIVAGVIGIVAGTLADFVRERWTPR